MFHSFRKPEQKKGSHLATLEQLRYQDSNLNWQNQNL